MDEDVTPRPPLEGEGPNDDEETFGPDDDGMIPLPFSDGERRSMKEAFQREYDARVAADATIDTLSAELAATRGALPDTYYAHLPLWKRVDKMASAWGRAVKLTDELADERDKFRDLAADLADELGYCTRHVGFRLSALKVLREFAAALSTKAPS